MSRSRRIYGVGVTTRTESTERTPRAWPAAPVAAALAAPGCTLRQHRALQQLAHLTEHTAPDSGHTATQRELATALRALAGRARSMLQDAGSPPLPRASRDTPVRG